MYKKILTLLMFAALCLTGCEKSTEKHWDLAVDALSYTLPYTGDSFPLYVYCDGAWTASFDGAPDWISILPGTESGHGNGVVRIEYRDNDEALREATLQLKSGERAITVSFSQKYDSTHLEVL